LYFNNYVNKIVNHPDFIDIDKLTQLKFAQECGLHIPETIITSSKETLLKFNRKFNLIITKNIASSLTLYLEEKIFKTYTSEIDNDFIKTLPESFFPSLFQQYIEKEYELRIIYINERIFSCVLLDSRNKPTDIREATNNNEVEIYPYKLPVAIENRLREFMHKINLQIGSIDMIYNTEKKYVFLEVNPSGQFLGYSTACNYQVEKVIAEYLIELENEKN
jgi:glutathione synthase/RimK-type ligase-like ATP-grasp enzyme